MNGDIALAGFVLTADEWEELDPLSRAQMMADEWEAIDARSRTQLATVTPREEPWVVVGLSAVLTVFAEGSQPNIRPAELTAQLDNDLDLDFDDLT